MKKKKKKKTNKQTNKENKGKMGKKDEDNFIYIKWSFDLLGIMSGKQPRGKKDRDVIGFFCQRKKERELVSFFSCELSKSRWI